MPLVRLVRFLLLLALVAMPASMATPGAAMPADHHKAMPSDHCDTAALDQEDEERNEEARLHCLSACTFLPALAGPLAAVPSPMTIAPVAIATFSHRAFNPAAEPPPPRNS